ncbi:cytochrome P450 [Nocardiopsis terrae]|uniref:Cytochrome P450 n=1 Tax=Nocardiopsis terrae TaxID=372655 RepID=A0ABR9HG34_9ACTN|nr:cytochrome P450 [Nocardiopsis terrae]MBE1457922.1 cytochrome P450 [Nocardiopsis terrae]GHC83494.1 cytochrome P450 [Nocardiopsis terrae]
MSQGTGSTGGDAAHGGEGGVARCPLTGEGALPLHRADGPAWDRLRSRYGGLAPVQISPGVPGWLLLGYKENLQVLRDQTHFSADARRWAPGGVPPARSGALARDGDEHQRLRLPLVDALASVGTPQLVPVVERAAVHLIGRVEARGSADLIGGYAAPLTALVLNELFGLSDSYGHLLADLTARLWSGDPERAEAAAPALRSYFRGLVARKRAEPGQDVASLVLGHPHGLTDEEAVEALSLLWETGHEPTTHLIGNSLLTLLEDPNVWTAYLGGTLAPEDFVDYVMWTAPPIRMLAGRYPTMDLRFAGARIGRGEPLLFGFASAHTDPSVSRGADDAMALAGNRSHLSWGAGAHRCPATAFARELVRTAIDTAVDRMRGMVMAVEPEELRWRTSLTVHGLVELPVWFTPTGERDQRGEEPEPEPGRSPVRWVRRRKRRPTAQGARYQAPLGKEDERGERPARERPLRAAGTKPRRAAPRGAGARYQAPFAQEEHTPDPLERLLQTWRAETGSPRA